jgi:hypothetical protein
MPKMLLLNMRDYVIVREYETSDAAQEAQDAPEFRATHDFPVHFVDREDWDLTATDLVKFYNNLEGAPGKPIKRFENRAIGMARVLRVLNGETAPVTDEMADKEATRKARTGEFHDDTASTSTEGESDMAKKKAAKGKKAPGATKRVAKDFTVEATAAGKKDDIRMNAESIRTKILAVIKKRDSIGVDELEKKFPDLKRPAIVGAVRYLSAKGYVRIN